LRGAITVLGLVACAIAPFACGGEDDEGGEAAAFAIYDWEPNLVEAAPYADRGEAEDAAADSDGSIVVEAASQYYVIRDEPAVTTDDVASAEAVTSAATGEPAVDVELTPEGRAAFEELTRSVAKRTEEQREALHFAIVIGDRVLSLPIIDTEQNPNGLSARGGLTVEGGLTESQAREIAADLG
jgi:preprotein translocase subunit SecD